MPRHRALPTPPAPQRQPRRMRPRPILQLLHRHKKRTSHKSSGEWPMVSGRLKSYSIWVRNCNQSPELWLPAKEGSIGLEPSPLNEAAFRFSVTELPQGLWKGRGRSPSHQIAQASLQRMARGARRRPAADVVALQLAIERRAADAQHATGQCFVAVDLLEDAADGCAFNVFEVGRG